MRHIRIYLISLCLMMVTACDDSDPSKGCKKNSDCSDAEQVCNTHTGKCEAQTSQENKCHSDVDCQSSSETPICNTVTGKCEAQTSQENKCQSDVDCQSTSETPICNKVTGKCEAQTSQENKCHTDGDCPTDSPKCNEDTGKCVACLLNNDCTNDENPRCIHETGKCEVLTYGKKTCQTDADCTDSFYSKCNTDIKECTSPCLTDQNCRICAENEKCLESDVPVCNKMKHLCEAYADCTIESSNPCYTKCSDDNAEYFAWLNGNLINIKCKDNSCAVSEKKIGVEPDSCEIYSTPPESCQPETSAMLCSPNGKSIWSCDSTEHIYIENQCDAETEHCVQCQNRAGCMPIESCTIDSTKNCNSVCNAEGDGYYLWDFNAEVVYFHACPQNDCIHICGTAECKTGAGFHIGESCEDTLKYCTAKGDFAFTCSDGKVVQKACANSDCVYDSGSNEITSCTAE
ncbi:MAG: hypothetical protein IKY83_12810 [Proteobacteria bacterium]|nr:hypothetical protein [Pseudomonadota bacterium]